MMYGGHHMPYGGQPMASPMMYAGQPVPPPAAPKALPSPVLFVGGLPSDIEDQVMRGIFEPHGVVSEVVCLPNKSRTGQRCAFVTFANADDAKLAVTALNGQYRLTPESEAIIVRFKDAPKSAAPSPPVHSQHYGHHPGYGQQPAYGQPPMQQPRYDAQAHVHHGMMHAGQYYPQEYGQPDAPQGYGGYANPGGWGPPPSYQPAQPNAYVANSYAASIQEPELLTSTKLFIGGLSEGVGEDMISSVFAPYGEIESIVSLQPKGTSGQHCGFVVYKDEKSAKAALVLHQTHRMLPSDADCIVVRYADRPGAPNKKKRQMPF